MSTTLTQRITGFLHLGKIPQDVRAQLLSEGQLLYLAEGIAETAILRNFTAPGNYASYRRISFIGFFVLTERRLVARARFYDSIDINAAYDSPLFQQLTFKTTRKYLSIAYDPSIQSPRMSGKVEIRLHLPDAVAAASILVEKGALLTAEGIAL